MKTKIVLTTCLLILSACFVNNIILANKTQNKDITILSTPRLNQLSNKLINEYKKTYPEQNIQGVDFEEINLSESLTNTMSLALVSQEDISSLIDQSLWKMLIGRDVIVPVINAGNPFLDTLEKQGITPTGLAEIIRMGKGTWGKLLGSGNDRQVNIYTMSDKSIRPALSAFLKINPSEFQVVEMNSLNDFKKVILNDPFSIGFCRIIDVLVSENQGIAENIRLLPIDKNENGRIDYHEKIYDNPENFMRGVWIGKYPKLLVQNIYLVAGNFPKNKEVSDFAGWILTEGQQFLEPESFSEL
ncbi:MAG: hypothetical protein HQ541_19530, partial [Mariniphaga sp.]|nr:hypothetical protein [Mariniphaga sp.]